MRSSWPEFAFLLAVAYIGYFHRAQMIAVLVIIGTVLLLRCWMLFAQRFPMTAYFLACLMFGGRRR